jgi:anti-sigma factor RsiW
MDKLFEYHREEPIPFLQHIQIEFHLFHCSRCAEELKKTEQVRDIIRTSFFVPPPYQLEDRIMAEIEQETQEAYIPAAAGFTFRGWVITGFVILISLATASLGINFSRLAEALGASFLLPVGITVGVVITGYGALFIGSHLEELSDRFGIH